MSDRLVSIVDAAWAWSLCHLVRQTHRQDEPDDSGVEVDATTKWQWLPERLIDGIAIDPSKVMPTVCGLFATEAVLDQGLGRRVYGFDEKFFLKLVPEGVQNALLRAMRDNATVLKHPSVRVLMEEVLLGASAVCSDRGL